jgi:hypothetical protein
MAATTLPFLVLVPYFCFFSLIIMIAWQFVKAVTSIARSMEDVALTYRHVSAASASRGATSRQGDSDN